MHHSLGKVKDVDLLEKEGRENERSGVQNEDGIGYGRGLGR